MFLTQILTNEFAQNNCIHTIYTCHRCKKMKLLHVGSEISCIVSFFSKNDFSINDYDNRHMQHLIKMELFLWFKFECLMYNRSNIGETGVKHIVINEAMKTRDTNKQRFSWQNKISLMLVEVLIQMRKICCHVCKIAHKHQSAIAWNFCYLWFVKLMNNTKQSMSQCWTI